MVERRAQMALFLKEPDSSDRKLENIVENQSWHARQNDYLPMTLTLPQSTRIPTLYFLHQISVRGGSQYVGCTLINCRRGILSIDLERQLFFFMNK